MIKNYRCNECQPNCYINLEQDHIITPGQCVMSIAKTAKWFYVDEVKVDKMSQVATHKVNVEASFCDEFCDENCPHLDGDNESPICNMAVETRLAVTFEKYVECGLFILRSGVCRFLFK